MKEILYTTQEKPREKLKSKGVLALTNQELLAILLGHGTQKKSVFHLSKDLSLLFQKEGSQLSENSLKALKGLGPVQRQRVVAAKEFFHRLYREKERPPKINSPLDVLHHLQDIRNKKQEHFLVISLNGANEVLDKHLVSIGTLNETLVHPREVFTDPITLRAAAIIIAHNHPSGTLKPSEADLRITKQLQKAGKILGIPILDHIIIAKKGYYSFKSHSHWDI